MWGVRAAAIGTTVLLRTVLHSNRTCSVRSCTRSNGSGYKTGLSSFKRRALTNSHSTAGRSEVGSGDNGQATVHGLSHKSDMWAFKRYVRQRNRLLKNGTWAFRVCLWDNGQAAKNGRITDVGVPEVCDF
ncbi:hypothetical protein AVEN_126101-1 [Araneus ventricosus]|uniref:Secreted protein n=1 Tax=Araneus ventricosus TaxID=182803 RepID=A0A4Y2CM07_ARAVE|nr:hypothetical protein AVEN_126101-1 [Araneus ventricosus]